jgi:hypothetical protein
MYWLTLLLLALLKQQAFKAFLTVGIVVFATLLSEFRKLRKSLQIEVIGSKHSVCAARIVLQSL